MTRGTRARAEVSEAFLRTVAELVSELKRRGITTSTDLRPLVSPPRTRAAMAEPQTGTAETACPKCRHPWDSHGLVPRGTDWPPCCTVNVGQGDPCGCSDVHTPPGQRDGGASA